MSEKLKSLLSSLPIQLICRFILGGVFIYAAIHKIADPGSFADTLHNYQLFPNMFIHFLAIFVPWLEMVAGIFLVVGIFPKGSSFIISGMLVAFIIALSINLARGLDIDCGCFDPQQGEHGSLWGTIIRDIFYLIPGMIVLFFSKSKSPIQE
jgi:uncharacterized membrane protein YphA (DoxX/SURF4 family)